MPSNREGTCRQAVRPGTEWVASGVLGARPTNYLVVLASVPSIVVVVVVIRQSSGSSTMNQIVSPVEECLNLGRFNQVRTR